MTRLLSPKRILVLNRATDKWDAIRRLTDVFLQSGDLRADAHCQALHAMIEREKQASTGIGPGFAIPHGVVEGLNGEIAALGIFREGVDFKGRHDQPSHIILALLYPPTDRNAHLHNVASAVRLLSSPNLCPRLAAARDPEDAFDFLSIEENAGLHHEH